MKKGGPRNFRVRHLEQGQERSQAKTEMEMFPVLLTTPEHTRPCTSYSPFLISKHVCACLYFNVSVCTLLSYVTKWHDLELTVQR